MPKVHTRIMLCELAKSPVCTLGPACAGFKTSAIGYSSACQRIRVGNLMTQSKLHRVDIMDPP